MKISILQNALKVQMTNQMVLMIPKVFHWCIVACKVYSVQCTVFSALIHESFEIILPSKCHNNVMFALCTNQKLCGGDGGCWNKKMAS